MGTLAVLAVLPALAGCGSSTAGLIPAANADPLKQDFEAVARAAREGNGSCAETDKALQQTQADFEALPSSVKSVLRTRLEQGIGNLKSVALARCAERTATTTTTSLTRTTTAAPQVLTTTSTVLTTTAQSPPATTSTPSEESNGGAQAPPGAGREGGAEPGSPEGGNAPAGGGGR
ncbi:MAG: hypothetical protein KGJ43_09315 [Acidobacteriota bacterium]|nr:hypothetical protein [Acidobacteriota bacterium]